MTEQGQSHATPAKEYHIKCVVKMRLTQRKFQRYIKQIRVFDIFSGDGQNSVSGINMQGSPLEIADAIIESGVDAFFVASDIREFAVEMLDSRLAKKTYPDMFREFRYSVNKNSAEDQLDIIHKYLDESEDNHAIVIVDPNGPKVLPFEKLRSIMQQHGRQCDMILNIAEGHLSRIMACSVTKDKNWWAKYDSIIRVIWDVINTTGNGWLRMPLRIEGNPGNVNSHRWRFVCTWGWCPPKNEWAGQNFFRVNSYADLKQQMEGKRS